MAENGGHTECRRGQIRFYGLEKTLEESSTKAIFQEQKPGIMYTNIQYIYLHACTLCSSSRSRKEQIDRETGSEGMSSKSKRLRFPLAWTTDRRKSACGQQLGASRQPRDAARMPATTTTTSPPPSPIRRKLAGRPVKAKRGTTYG
jgi:hypothetical protein